LQGVPIRNGLWPGGCFAVVPIQPSIGAVGRGQRDSEVRHTTMAADRRWNTRRKRTKLADAGNHVHRSEWFSEAEGDDRPRCRPGTVTQTARAADSAGDMPTCAEQRAETAREVKPTSKQFPSRPAVIVSRSLARSSRRRGTVRRLAEGLRKARRKCHATGRPPDLSRERQFFFQAVAPSVEDLAEFREV